MYKTCNSQPLISSSSSSTAVTRVDQKLPSNTALTRSPIVPALFYTTSVAQDRRMDTTTLGQAFNVAPTDLTQLLNAASIVLAERGILNKASRSRVMSAARAEAVLTAIRSLPLFGEFFDKWMKRYEKFVTSMVASIATICDRDFRVWRDRRGEGCEVPAGVDPGEKSRAANTTLPTPPPTPRKKTPLRRPVAKAAVKGSGKRRRSAKDMLASPAKMKKKTKTRKDT